MEEVWKDVVGYEGRYLVSNLGNVFSCEHVGRNQFGATFLIPGRLLSQATHRQGYKYVSIDNKIRLIHRLVAQAFIPNPNNYRCVNHKDEDKANNRVDNLEWCTHKYNSNYGTYNERISKLHINHEGLSAPVLCLLNGKVVAEYPSMQEAFRQTGALQPNILKCCQGKRHTAAGFGWQYKNGRKKPEKINRKHNVL